VADVVAELLTDMVAVLLADVVAVVVYVVISQFIKDPSRCPFSASFSVALSASHTAWLPINMYPPMMHPILPLTPGGPVNSRIRSFNMPTALHVESTNSIRSWTVSQLRLMSLFGLQTPNKSLNRGICSSQLSAVR
jgi:hypothetical protein